MNTEVEIHVGGATVCWRCRTRPLRTQRDVTSAAQVLGLDPNDVQQQLAAARQQPSPSRDSASLGGARHAAIDHHPQGRGGHSHDHAAGRTHGARSAGITARR